MSVTGAFHALDRAVALAALEEELVLGLVVAFPDRFVPLPQVAEVLDLSASAVRELVRREGLPVYRLSKTAARVHGRDLNQFLARAAERELTLTGCTSQRRSTSS